MDEEKINLFVYGSLRDPGIFKSVSGFSFSIKPSKTGKETLFAEPALLANYRKISPDNVYFYGIAEPSSKIDGLVIRSVSAAAMAEIDRYEGKRYIKEAIKVTTASDVVEAYAYLTTSESMKKYFGDRFRVNLIHELWLRKRIEKFLAKITRPGDKTADAELERRADRELLATTERDLIISHYHTDAVGDYYLEHELRRPRPSIKHLYGNPEAEPFIENYLALVIKQVLFSQLEAKIYSRYRFEIEHMRTSERYFKHSVSVVSALQIINSCKPTVDRIIEHGLETIPYHENDIIDYVKYAVRAAKSIFDSRVAESNLWRIRSNLRPGLVPMGAELELSNLGAGAVSQGNSDSVYDGFRYFYDFNLDILCWKLGGYIDDHSGETGRTSRRGFLEFAPGRLNITGQLSRPVTADPWLLNQLIHEIVIFYDIRPHSLHLSFQLRKKQIGSQKIMPLDFVKCLFVLGGGIEKKNTGRLRVSRLSGDEITQNDRGEELVFARTSEKKWYLGEDEIADRPPAQAAAYVQQYKFIRLDERANYEPLILALKGLQLDYNPADYLTAEQLTGSRRLRQNLAKLKKWAAEPSQISRKAISLFTRCIRSGLMKEAHHRPAHKLHYINWGINAIDVRLRMFNKHLEKTADGRELSG